MKPLMSIKTLFRTPFRTLLTFLLLAAVTFALFSRVAEYAILNRELDKAANTYKGFGAAEITPAPESYPELPLSLYIFADSRYIKNYPKEDQEYFLNNLRYQPLTRQQVQAISKLPYIENTDVRYMTAGVSDQYNRLEEGSGWGKYREPFVIESTISDIVYNRSLDSDDIATIRVILDKYKLIAGDPSNISEGKQISINADILKHFNYSDEKGPGGILGYIFSLSPNESTIDNTDYLKKLKIGERYIFVVTSNGTTNLVYSFSDFLRVEGSVEETLKTEECADLREIVDMVNADLHTLDVVYTDNMSAIMRFAQNKMMIQSGRLLTEADNVNESNVCVISTDFAKANNLVVGDKMTLKLGTDLFEQYKGLGAVAYLSCRYSPAVKTVNLEIVGIYIDTDGQKGQLNEPNWSYSINTVFVPKSLLPVDESTLTDHVYSPAEFSFTVNARDILDFEKTAPAEFEKLGLNLIFNNDGWPSVVEAFKTSKQLSLIAIAGSSAATIAATGFIVFLFIVRKKREYAIMRALGTPKKAAGKALILPLMVLSITAVITGSGAAWIYTVLTVARNNALSIIENYTVDASLPPWVLIGCIVGELLLVFAFAILGLRRAASSPPLRLLQENQTSRKMSRKAPKTKYITIQPRIPDVTAIPVINELPKPLKKKKKHMPQMNPLLSIKTLLRTPFKTLLTFLLLAAVTFALFSQVAEYAILNRELDNAANSYKGIGSAEVTPAVESYSDNPFYIDADPRVIANLPEDYQAYYLNQFRYQPLTDIQIKTISELSNIETTCVRYMTAGVSDKYYRVKEGSDWFNYANKFVIEGTISNIEYNLFFDNYLFKNSDDIMKNKITLYDYKILAGDSSCFSGRQIAIDAYSMISKDGNSMGGSSDTGLWTFSYNQISQYDTEYLKSLTIGDSYIIVGYFHKLNDYPVLYLGDYFKELSCQIIQPVKGSIEETLNTEECANLREYIEMVNADIHTLDVVYTDNMSAIMRFAKNNMMIQSGRMLTEADNVNGSNICVISNDFAKANNLAVGDKMTLKLGTELFEQYKGLGAVASSLNRYSPAVNEVELEIVGIYIDTDGANGQLKEPHWSYSVNTVFVPKTFLPVDENTLTDYVYSPAEFSFTVNARDILEFEKTAPAEFEKLGLKLIFDDDGWPSVVEAFETSKQLSLIAIAGLSVATIAATGFIVFLFIVRKKREYAIMRALGTPRKASARALILPLMVLSIAAVLAGSGAAWVYTLLTVARNNALSLIEDYTVDASLPPWAMIGCIAAELLLVLAFAAIGLKRAASIPPLRLLQENQTGKKKIRKNPKTKYIEAHTQAVNFTAISAFDELPKSVKKNNGHVLRYIARHMRRSIGKSLLSLLLPALLLGAFGQFMLSQRAQVELGNNTVVEAKLVGGLQPTYIDKFRKNDSVTNVYYEYQNTVGFNESKGTLIMTNDIPRFTNKQPEITFLEGYDITCMDSLNPVCIVGSEFLKTYSLQLGDQLHITGESTLDDIKSNFLIQYRAKNPFDGSTDEEVLNAHQAVIKVGFDAKGLYYTIVGEVTSSLGNYDTAVFSPGTKDSQRIYGGEIPDGYLAFTLTDPLHAHEFGRTVEKMFQINQGEIGSGNLAFVMDTSKIDHILNTISLMKKLYPAVVAAGVLIGSFICGLIVIQSSKEAAILRVLGTTRKRTGAILALEQLFLCFIGLLIGTGGLLIYKGSALGEIAGELGFFAGLYFTGCLACSIACSAIATRRNVLELLQTKE